MKNRVKKYQGLALIVLIAVFVFTIFITSPLVAKAEGEDIVLPVVLKKDGVAYQTDVSQPIAENEEFKFTIGETEHTITRGTHFTITDTWQYKAFNVPDFVALDTSNFEKPGIYTSNIALVEGANLDGVALALSDNGSRIEYIIGISVAQLNGPDNRIFNDKPQALSATYRFENGIEVNDVKFSPVLGTDFEILGEWKFSITPENEASFEVLDLAQNNFTHAGTYRVSIKSLKSQYITNETSIIEYKIGQADATSFIHKQDGASGKYFAKGVKGITLKDTFAVKLNAVDPLKGKWEIENLDTYGAISINDDFEVDASNFSTTEYAFKFAPDAEYENDYKNTDDINLIIQVLKKPEVRFVKFDNTSFDVDPVNIELVEGDAKYKFNIKNAEARAGYNFKGWMLDDVEDSLYPESPTVKVEFDIQARYIFTQKWEAKTDTKFKLKYKFETLSEEDEDGNLVYRDGLGPTGLSDETSEGTTGENLTDEQIDELGSGEGRQILGFEFNKVKTLADEDNKNFTIKGDGSSTYTLFYVRKSFTFTFKAKEGEENVTGTFPTLEEMVRFGSKINIPDSDVAKKGYQFNGYKDGLKKTATQDDRVFKVGEVYHFNESSKDMHETAIVNLIAVFSARTDVPYIVYHKLADGTDVKEPEIIKNGTTDKEVSGIYSAQGYVRIDSPNAEHKQKGSIMPTNAKNTLTLEELLEVTEEEGKVLELYCYYKIIEGTYTYSNKEGETPINIKYGDKIKLGAKLPDEATRVFLGWQIEGSGKIYKAGSEIVYRGGDLVFTPAWGFVKSDTIAQDKYDNTFALTKEKTKLSGGAIAGIVIACLVVVGIATFSIIWFGVMKKSFKDLNPKNRAPGSSKKGKRGKRGGKGGFLK